MWRGGRYSQAGFSPIEVLLAASVFGLIVTALVGGIIYGRAATATAGDRTRAVLLADEGIQATENIRSDPLVSLANGTYGLSQTGGQWAFAGTSDSTGAYTRQITIASAGSGRKLVTSTVTWPGATGTTNQVSVATRLVEFSLDLQLWGNAILAGSSNLTGSTDALKVASQGSYAYAVMNGATNNFVVADVSNPAAPAISGTVTLAGTPTNVFVSGNYAYVTTTSDTAELIVVNISSPTAPAAIGTYNAAGSANGLGVFVAGTTAYLTRAANGGSAEFVVLSVATPSAPTLLGSYGNNLAMNEVYVSGTTAYVATSSISQEMLVIAVANPAVPALLTAYNAPTLSAATSITGSGSTIFLGTGLSLHAVSVLVPAVPLLLGTYLSLGTVQDVAVDVTGQYAFLATAALTSEFQVINISVPVLMTLAKGVDVAGLASTLNGVGYNADLDIVVGASASDSQEILTFTRN